ncbi:MAG: YopX family protein [Tannerella sp.]|jgi:uncharacterized phage protein (TIGR01671 family)|nr:YopX family protein [Tannerella sp.]
MNREILFRAKALDSGKWKIGSLVTRKYGRSPKIYLEIPGQRGVNYDDVDANTVGQFTGLNDKNGVKIFEGDIVSIKMLDVDRCGRFMLKTNLPNSLNARVEYSCRHGKYKLLFVENAAGLISCDIGYSGEEFEVVGNIYDNQELLK